MIQATALESICLRRAGWMGDEFGSLLLQGGFTQQLGAIANMSPASAMSSGSSMCSVRASCCRHTWLVRGARTAWVPLSRASQAPSLRHVWPQPLAAVRKLRRVETGAPAADPRARPIPCMHFDAAPQLLPGVLMVWDFCHRYRCKQG